ncbi:MAG TPA: O-antigen ligase family protein [Thermopolyspora sp.]|jgi:O-Antigen ligase.
MTSGLAEPLTIRRADGATLVTLLIMALMLIPARLVFRGIPLSLTPANLLGLVCGLCWLCAQFTTTLGVAKGRTPVRTAVFVYATGMLATYGYATYGYLPSDELNFADHALVLIMANVGIALAVCDGVRGGERLDLVLKAVVVAGAVIGFIGVVQYVLKFDLTRYLALPGLRYTSEDSSLLERYDVSRVASTTGHPIEFGVVCAMMLPLAVHYGYRTREIGRPSLRWWVCAALIGMGLMFSVSRSAVLATGAVGLVLFVGWPGRRRAQALLLGVLFLAAVRVIAPGLLGTLYDLFANIGNDSSIQYRTHDYTIAATEIGKHLWLGRGAGTWYSPKYAVFDNTYILSTVETGVLGVAAIVGMFLAAIYSAALARHRSEDPGVRDLALTLAACLVAPVVTAATFDLLSFATVTGVSFLLIGATGSLLRTVTESDTRPAARAHWFRRIGGDPGARFRGAQKEQGSGPTVEVTR